MAVGLAADSENAPDGEVTKSDPEAIAEVIRVKPVNGDEPDPLF